MKTKFWIFTFCVVCFSFSAAFAGDLSPGTRLFSVRIRPIAIAYGILGAEIYYQAPQGYFAGLTASLFDESNSDKQTALSTQEFGIKVGKFFGHDQVLESGWWGQVAINLDHTRVSSFYAVTGQTFTGIFYQAACSLTAGYQFRMTFIDPQRFNLRFGGGVGFKPKSVTTLTAADGSAQPVGVRQRLDPVIEFTVGYLL